MEWEATQESSGTWSQEQSRCWWVPKLAIWGNTGSLDWPDGGGSSSSTVNEKVDWEM
jgi:hypothetical protein